jgi:DNA-binding beta-propeller fold protein YncE
MRKVLLVIGLVLGVAVAFAALMAYREYSIGEGPVVTAATPEGPTVEIAFVANAVGGTITAIDVAARQVVGTFTVIPDGTKVGVFRSPTQSMVQSRIERRGLNYAQDTDLSPDGRVLYVSRGNLADVVAFDLATGNMLWRRAIGIGRSDHMAITADGRYLFVSDLRNARVKRIDTHTARLDGEFVTGVFPHDIQFSHDGKLVYNASLGDMQVEEKDRDNVQQPTADHGYAYQITVAEVATLKVVDTFRFPRGIRPFHLTHDSSGVYAQLSNTHGVVRYDTSQRAVVEQLELPVADGVGPSDWDFDAPHHGLAMTTDEKFLCVAARASDYAGIISTGPLTLVATVPTSDAPSWSVIDSTNQVCITANTRADEVSIVSLAEQKEIARLRTGGRGPKHVTLGQVPVAVVAAIKEWSSSPAL